jgi:ribokinase
MVVSLGSVNMDLVVRCRRAPSPGETVVSTGWLTNPGGKGANQAVQASRMGSVTMFVGRIGSDSFGRELLDGLHRYGVDTSGVSVDSALPSGIACILVEDDGGENRIVVVPGANASVGATEIAILDHLLNPGDILMLQCEIPFNIVRKAAHLGRERKAVVILDPSPVAAIGVEPGVFADVDYLMPNEGEACMLAGKDDVQSAVQRLLELGAQTVVLKRGDKGALAAGAVKSAELPAFKVQPVDTTAAGDSFQGAFAASLDRGFSPEKALYRAMAAGALTVTRPGAQQSMPDEADVIKFLDARLHNGDYSRSGTFEG